MRRAVETELLKCVTELGELPPLLTKEPSTEIMLRVSAFPKILKTRSWDANTTISSKRTERDTQASNLTSR